MRFIGDVHGKFEQYFKLIEGVEESIQVGDFGLGFGGADPVPPVGHRFLRGNHDSPAVCANNSGWIADGTIDRGMAFIGGAWSIDRQYRTEGVDWWPDEELSYAELNQIIFNVTASKPKIIVTHDCPQSISMQLFNPMVQFPNRTSQALDILWHDCKPKVWIFGHWHQNRVEKIGDTVFICLAELCYVDIDINIDTF